LTICVLTLRQEANMPFGTLALYLALPFSTFFMLQSIPELRGFLDYGATAALAAYMVWLWNKHTLRWQDKQEQVEAAHRAAMERLVGVQSEMMTRLVDRYDTHVEKMAQALERNSESNLRIIEAIQRCKRE